MSKAISSDAATGWAGRQFVSTSIRLTQWTFAAMRLVLLLATLFLVAWVANYNPVTWDLTEARLFSLSDQSLGVLGSLEQPVSMIAFVRGADDPATQRALEAYADASPLISVRLVDPEADPALAAEFQVRDYNTLVVQSGDRVQRAAEVKEPAITNAILAVTRGEPVPVCFLFGHGERNPDDRDRVGLSAASTALSQTNYEVRLTNMAVSGGVPDDCRVVVLAGPTTDIQSSEREALETYLDGGGRLLALLESRAQIPEVAALLARYGVTPNDDFIIDTGRNGQAFGLGVQVPMVDAYNAHPVTDGFRLMTMYNMPRSLTIADPMPAGLAAVPLAVSTRSSWGESAYSATTGATWDEGEDLAGPLAMVVAVAGAVEETPAAYRVRMRGNEPAPVGDPLMIVVGDVDFASNAFFGWQGNGDLTLNSVSWLAGQDDLISIRPKEVANKRVLLTNSRRALTFTLLVILLPLLPAVTGVVTMIKKVK
jgi:ABC-type uncharacterized transport system involved in gliding motility auxiliary subunit